MGLFSLFRRKAKDTDDFLSDAEVVEAMQRASGEEEERDELPKERKLINQIMLAFDKKSKLVRAVNFGYKAAGRMINGLRSIGKFSSVLGKQLKALPKRTGVAATGGMEKVFGVTWDAQKAKQAIWKMQDQVAQINQQVTLVKAREAPIFKVVQNKLNVIDEQLALLRQYIDVLMNERRLTEDQMSEALRILKDLEEEQKVLEEQRDYLYRLTGEK